MAALTAAVPVLALAEAYLAWQNIQVNGQAPQGNQATAKNWLQGQGSMQQIRTALSAVLANVWAQSFTAGAAFAAELLELVVQLATDDTISRLTSEWVDGIVNTYLNLLSAVLAKGGDHADLVKALKAVLSDKDHATTIAQTEIARGKNSGAYWAYRQTGTTYVRWIYTSHDPCQECIDNNAAGRWPLGQPFPSGAIMPPDHPHCQCHLEPA